MSSRSFVFLNNSSFRSANHLTVIHLVNDHKRNVEFDFILYHFFRSGVMSLFTLSARKWGHPCTMDILFFSFGNCCDILPAFEDRFNILLRVPYIVSLCSIHTFFHILRKYSGTYTIGHLSFPTSCDIQQKFMVLKYFCFLK